MTKRKQPTHGGARKGAGRKPDDPSGQKRVPWSGRLAPATVDTLKRHATPAKSQAEIVDEAVDRWRS